MSDTINHHLLTDIAAEIRGSVGGLFEINDEFQITREKGHYAVFFVKPTKRMRSVLSVKYFDGNNNQQTLDRANYTITAIADASAESDAALSGISKMKSISTALGLASAISCRSCVHTRLGQGNHPIALIALSSTSR